MVEAITPAVVPSSRGSSAVSACADRGSVRGLPAAELAVLPRDSSLVCRIASVDARGRVAEQSVVRALGWAEGQRLDIRVVAGVIMVRADASGVFALARRCHVPIPAAVRRWCGLATGERVLLAADPDQGVLLVHTMAAVEEMLRARHAVLWGGEHA